MGSTSKCHPYMWSGSTAADLQEVRVRFSAPGFVDATHVGLYYNYIGLPAGEKHLEIEWDEEGSSPRSSSVST